MSTQGAAPRLGPLVIATMASQGLLVVLAPTIVAVSRDLEISVGTAGQARSITAIVAIAVSIYLASASSSPSVPAMITKGGMLAVVGLAAIAVAPSGIVFLAAHVITGVAFALLLSAGFSGIAAFSADRRSWAMGHVAAANGLAWIVVNPMVGIAAAEASWRIAYLVPAVIAGLAVLLARRAAPVPWTAAPLGARRLLSAGSARRWMLSELIAFGAWTAMLVYVGAFFIQEFGLGEGTVGWFLAIGAGAYFIAATRSGGLVTKLSRRGVVAVSALVMAVAVLVQLDLAGSVIVALVAFCFVGLAAGLRTPASSGLGIDQIPEHPSAMMAARTAVTQLGYLFGAVMGGAMIAGFGYAGLGLAVALGMAVSASLITMVDDPRSNAAAT